MIQVSLRDKKILIVGGVFIALYLILVFIAKPAFRENKLAHQKIQDKILFIEKCYEILNQKSYYKAKSTENKSVHTTLSQRFLNETKPVLAAAEQQRILEELANKTGVNIIRFRVDKPKYVEKLLTISTQVTVRSKLRDLTSFIHRLEGNEKFMIIEEILAQRINKEDLEELQTQLTVSGFIKKMEEEKIKAT